MHIQSFTVWKSSKVNMDTINVKGMLANMDDTQNQ